MPGVLVEVLFSLEECEMTVRSNSLVVSLVIAVVACLSMGVQATAATLVYDSFTGADGTVLNGRTPDITIGGATWTGNGGISGNKADLGEADLFLPFTPAVNSVYTLSAELTAPAASGNWMGLSFEGANRLWTRPRIDASIQRRSRIHAHVFPRLEYDRRQLDRQLVSRWQQHAVALGHLRHRADHQCDLVVSVRLGRRIHG
jgi:hypothetical protein